MHCVRIRGLDIVRDVANLRSITNVSVRQVAAAVLLGAALILVLYGRGADWAKRTSYFPQGRGLKSTDPQLQGDGHVAGHRIQSQHISKPQEHPMS